MPRYDLITIDADGIIRRVKGLAHPWSPSIPKAPTGQLILAQIYQTWSDDKKPKVTNNAIRVVQMADIESMRNMISDLYYLISQLQLKNDANASDPTAKKGIFVDPFFDDDMRDQGTKQTGAIVDGKLTLPIDAQIFDFAKEKEVYLLPYELEPVIVQEYQTGMMKVNPYDAFDPLPVDVEVTLNIDHWTEVETEWLSPVTSYVNGRSSTSSYESLVNSTTKNLEYMRQIEQKFNVDGFRDGETISKMTFAGIEITPQANEGE